MTVNPESASNLDEDEVMFEDDVEELRKKLMLSAGLFLTSLWYHNILFLPKTEEKEQKKDETENKS